MNYLVIGFVCVLATCALTVFPVSALCYYVKTWLNRRN